MVHSHVVVRVNERLAHGRRGVLDVERAVAHKLVSKLGGTAVLVRQANASVGVVEQFLVVRSVPVNGGAQLRDVENGLYLSR